jgi:Tfp pilus assembly protein PilF
MDRRYIFSWSHKSRRHATLVLVFLSLISAVLAGCGGSDTEAAQQHTEQSLNLNKQGYYNEALEEANKAIELDPELAEAYNSRA